MNSEDTRDESVIELGAVSADTKGTGFGAEDSPSPQPKDPAGLIED
jgi:hypothetical protein